MLTSRSWMPLAVGLILLVSGVASGDTVSELFRQTLAQDLRTSSFEDLAAWCRRLGLSERGSREDLERRILDHYGVEAAAERTEDDQEHARYELTIEAADASEYFTLHEVDETYIRLSGRVVLELKDRRNEMVHRIEADRILLNQTLNLLHASGSIEYTVRGRDVEDRFSGQSLVFDLNTMEGQFLDGRTFEVRTLADVESTFSLSADLISRMPDDRIIMDAAVITSSEADPPNYHIAARRIWLLGGGDWGLQDAVLYVGRIPVFYFPFFFYPGDEVVFHPVFGYNPRSGSFIQTTTYLLGSKPRPQDTLSALQLTREAGDDRVREVQGIFLRETDRVLENGDNVVKALLDVYSRLGAFVGLQGSLEDVGVVQSIDFLAGLGVSRTLYQLSSGLYSPYFREPDGTLSTHWDETVVGAVRLPFRYGLHVTAQAALDGWRIKASSDFYSDPFVASDFHVRAEDQDWVSYILGKEEVPRPVSAKDTLSTAIAASYTADLPFLRPYLDRLSLNRLNLSFDYRSRELPLARLPARMLPSPGRRFYFPHLLIAPDVELQIGGTLFSTRGVAAPPSPADGRGDTAEGPALRPPWDTPAPEGERPAEEKEGLRPPEFPRRVSFRDYQPPLGFSLTYSLTPRFLLEFRTASAGWQVPEDIRLEAASQTMTSRNDARLAYDFSLHDRLFRASGALGLNLAHRSYDVLADGLSALEMRNARLDAYRNRATTLTAGLSATSNPFQNDPVWKSTSVRYAIEAALFRRSFLELRGSEPLFREDWLEWNTHMISRHEAGLLVQADTPVFTPSLDLSYVLPPLQERATATAGLVWGPLTSSVSFEAVREDGLWHRRPMTVTNGLTAGDFADASSSLVYDFDHDLLRSWYASLRLGFLSLGYTARYGEVYDFVPGVGWVGSGRTDFLPRRFTAQARYEYEPPPFWLNRIRWRLGLFGDYAMELDRFTESTMIVGVDFTFSIHRFLDLRFEAASRNTQFYRYFPALADRIGVSWVDPLSDIARSFNFWNDEERRRARFKLSSIAVEAVHHLDDWDLSIRYSGSPELQTLSSGLKEFRWNSLLTIFLAWRPFPEIRSEIRSDAEGISY